MSSLESSREVARIERSRAGDTDAFAELIEPWRTRLLGYLSRACGDPWRAEDLAQETLVRAWRGLASYDHRQRFGSWLLSIAHNVSVDHHRSSVRRAELALEGEVQARTNEDALSALVRKELGERLREAVDSLPERQRRVFLLRQHGTLKFREIAEVTGEPLSTVLGHMSYAAGKLRRIIEEYENE